MIELHQFAPAFGLPNPSPFCMKVEGLLRLAGLPYAAVIEDDPRKAPLGKLPYIVVDGQTVADSHVITEFLRTSYGFDVDEGLTGEQRAQHHAFIGMLENQTYWAGIYLRWVDDAGWPMLRQVFFGHLPWPLRQLIPVLARAKVRRDVIGQGLGNLTPEQVMETARRDYLSLSEYLGENPFFGGDKPVLLDLVATSLLANAIKGPGRSQWRQSMYEQPRLIAYTRRALQRIYAITLD